MQSKDYCEAKHRRLPTLRDFGDLNALLDFLRRELLRDSSVFVELPKVWNTMQFALIGHR